MLKSGLRAGVEMVARGRDDEEHQGSQQRPESVSRSRREDSHGDLTLPPRIRRTPPSNVEGEHREPLESEIGDAAKGGTSVGLYGVD